MRSNFASARRRLVSICTPKKGRTRVFLGLCSVSWQGPHELAQLPVFTLTGSSSAFDHAMALGATDFFTKPDSIQGLVDVIRTITVRWWFMEQARTFRPRPR